jgi:hypothetical protein
MSIIEKIKNLSLPEGALVTLSYSEGVDVFIHNETEVQTAMDSTSVIDVFAGLVATPGLHVASRWSGNILDSFRDSGYLDNYERGSFSFEYYISNLIHENFYNQDFIEHTTEKYDHKRGYCTLSTSVRVPASEIVSQTPSLSGWTVSVKTENGTLTF